MNFSDYPVTYTLMAINIVASFIGFSNANLIDKTILWPYRITRENQWYRFITSGFIHADTMHLIFNMFTFYFFGRAVEAYFTDYGLGGNIAYLLLYFLGMIAADIPSFLKNKNEYNYRALGASGAVSAVVFACILFNPWGTIIIYVIPMPFIVYAVLYLVYCVYMSKKGQGNINHDAHLWGSVFGFVFTLILMGVMEPALFSSVWYELTHPHFNLGS
jgi:membrane associated rhomboid family serine protease